MRKLTEDFIGTCQWCLGEYKVNGRQKMTLHGYLRPGHGFVIGQCHGVGHAPFEYENELTHKFLSQMIEESAKLDKMIKKIDGGLRKIANSSYREEGKRDRYYRDDTPQFLFPGDRMFDHAVKVLRANLTAALNFNNKSITHYEEMLANWTRGKIVGIDSPATGKTRELRDGYSAEDAEKKADLTAKRAERDAKPGKLMISVFALFAYPPRITDDSPESEALWKARYDKKAAAEKAFKDAVKAVAKKRYPGKIWVGAGYGGDIEHAYRRAGRPLDAASSSIEVTTFKPEWQYLDEVLAAFPHAVKSEEKNGKEIKIILSLEDFMV